MVTQPTATSVGQGTEIEYGPDQMAVALNIISQYPKALKSDYDQTRREMSAIAPTLIANNQMAPWTKDSKGEKVSFGGMDWSMDGQGTEDYAKLLAKEKYLKLRQERLQGGQPISKGDLTKLSLDMAGVLYKQAELDLLGLPPEEQGKYKEQLLIQGTNMVMQVAGFFQEPNSSQVGADVQYASSQSGDTITVIDNKTGEEGEVPNNAAWRKRLKSGDKRFTQKL